MLSIDNLTALRGPLPYAVQAGRMAQAFKRYFLISGAIASASLGVAVGVSVIALLFAHGDGKGAQTALVQSYYAEVSSAAAGEASALAVVPDLEPEPDVPASAALPPQAPANPDPDMVKTRGRIAHVNVTFYDCKQQGFCGNMYNGRKVYQGAAACSWNMALGTRFIIVGDPTRRTYVCEDRGLLANTWVDIFWNDPRDGRMWQALVGRYGTIEIVGLP